MALNPQSEDTYKRIAATLASRRQPAQQTSTQPIGPSQFFSGETPTEIPGGGSPQDWSLGQGIIDVLSSGTYFTAGAGRKIGENVQAIQQGNVGGALDLFNPISNIKGGVDGINDRRTWSENLADWGVEEGEDTGFLGMNQRDMGGLALDIILDPLWLIPGGAIAAAAKGTSKGVALASGLSTGGVKLTKDAVGAARKATEDFARPLLTDNITAGKEGVTVAEPIQQFFPQTGQKIPLLSGDGISNLVNGVRYATADEYARWGVARANKRKGTPEETKPFDQGPAGILSQLVKPIDELDETKPAAENAVRQAEEVIDNAPAARTVSDVEKDIDAAPKTVQEAIPAKVVREAVRDELAPAKSTFITGKNLDELDIDFDKVEVSPMAGDMADVYNRAVSTIDDPDTIRAYQDLGAEAREQYRYMTEDLGIRVEYVREDPYNINGVPSSKLMMEDVLNNKRLQVRDSVDDFATNPHPLWDVETNNIFRAVHDFFGHAGSGRGFDAAGEEAAWLSHSQMFTPLARRAMTTETRGQNSYYNKFGEFAPQKTFLFPEEYVLAPTQFADIERRVNATNQFIGLKSNALQEYADQLLEDLAMVWTPIRQSKLYSADEIKQIRQKYAELTDLGRYDAKTPEAQATVKLFDELEKYLTTPSRYASVARSNGGNSVTDLLRVASEALDVEGVADQKTAERALAMFRQILDEPVDATELLENALKLENRVITDPKPFKPTIWGPPAKPGVVTKPDFSRAKLEQYFPDDELLRDEQQLRLAMGETKFKPGSAGSKKAAQQQQIIWENFRARNHDYLAEVVEREKNDWFTANSIEASEFFTKLPNGTVIGQGALPAAIPKGTIYTLDGRPMTTLAKILDNLGSVINRTGPQMGGLPTTQIRGGAITGRTARMDDVPGSPVMGGGEIAAPTRKQIITAIRKRGREIELDSYPLATQAWLIKSLDGIKAKVAKEGASDARLMDEAMSVENLSTRMWDELPFMKSRADATKIAKLGPEAIVAMSKAPARKYFIDAPFSREIGRPDESGISRAASSTGTRGEAPVVARDPESGQPIDSTGKPVAEKEAEVIGGTQYRVLAEGGKAYTGRLAARSGSPAAPQTGDGPQQLAGLQAIRSTIGAINEAITGKNLAVTQEQSQLLASVLNTLQIRVADNATPSKIFTQFKQEALPRFEEIVARIESAAKIESVAFHAKAVFKVVDDEGISLMKAIEDYDVGELQRQTLKFTEDAMQLVDDTCRAGARGVNRVDGLPAGPAGQSVLDRVLGGLSG